MTVWDDILTERDRQVFAQAGFGARQGYGQRPAIVVVDVNYNFVGEQPEPILDAIAKSRNSCGEEGWEAVWQIQKLLEAGRVRDVPVFFTTNMERRPSVDAARPIGRKRARWAEDMTERARRGTEIVREIAPRDGEIVIRKDKPSAFFGTNLVGMLIERQVDTVLVAGVSTSGCVRATVVDASSYNFHVAVVEECVFDRGQASHKMSLFDMNAKWADVVSLADAQEYLASLPADLYMAS